MTPTHATTPDVIVLSLLGFCAIWLFLGESVSLISLPLCAIAIYLLCRFYLMRECRRAGPGSRSTRDQTISAPGFGEDLVRLKNDIARIEQRINDWKSRVG